MGHVLKGKTQVAMPPHPAPMMVAMIIMLMASPLMLIKPTRCR